MHLVPCWIQFYPISSLQFPLHSPFFLLACVAPFLLRMRGGDEHPGFSKRPSTSGIVSEPTAESSFGPGWGMRHRPNSPSSGQQPPWPTQLGSSEGLSAMLAASQGESLPFNPAHAEFYE